MKKFLSRNKNSLELANWANLKLKKQYWNWKNWILIKGLNFSWIEWFINEITSLIAL